MPEIPLMEDVELSLRLGNRGTRIYLWGGALVSNYKWQGGFFKRFSGVISLLLIFFSRRVRGKSNMEDLYARYYGKKDD
jgi:GT2 family glycosyltransferase